MNVLTEQQRLHKITKQHHAKRHPISRKEATESAMIKNGGKVLKVEFTEKSNRPEYVIRILLPNGRVRVVTVDAEK